MFLYSFSLVAVISLLVKQWLPQNYDIFSWDLTKKQKKKKNQKLNAPLSS